MVELAVIVDIFSFIVEPAKNFMLVGRLLHDSVSVNIKRHSPKHMLCTRTPIDTVKLLSSKKLVQSMRANAINERGYKRNRILDAAF